MYVCMYVCMYYQAKNEVYYIVSHCKCSIGEPGSNHRMQTVSLLCLKTITGDIFLCRKNTPVVIVIKADFNMTVGEREGRLKTQGRDSYSAMVLGFCLSF